MELTTQHFDMAFILIGNCINKDAALGTVQCTPGLKGVSLSILASVSPLWPAQVFVQQAVVNWWQWTSRHHEESRIVCTIITLHSYSYWCILYSNLALENFSHDYVVEHKNHRDERDTECMADSDEDGDMDGPVEVESKAVHVSADAGRNQIKSYFLGGFST